MGPKRSTKNPLERQTSVRLTKSDVALLEEMEDKIGRPRTDVMRYALRFYYRSAADAQWDLNIQGEPRIQRVDPPPDNTPHALPRGKALPS